MAATAADLVGDDGVASPAQGLYPPDLDDVCAGAHDVGAHGVQEVGQVHDVGLLGGVLDDGVALRQNGSHHDVHGGPHGHHVQIDVGAVETARLRGGVDEAALHHHLGAHGGEALHVLVDGPHAEVAAAGHGHLRLPEPAQQGADEVVGGPDLPGQVIAGAGGADVGAVDLHGVGIDGPDARAQIFQDPEAQRHVRDLGDVLNAADTVHQQGGGDDGHGGVLGAADGDLAVQGSTAVDNYFLQELSFFRSDENIYNKCY